MNIFKDSGHLFKFAACFVIGFLIYLGLRGFVVPKTFGQYGHYRGSALKELAAKPIKYAGHQVCEDCHTDQATAKSAGKHVTVNCEACHGALAAHANDPTNVVPVKPDPLVLCARCHTASAAKPKDFPQVNIDEHSGGAPCTICHTNPHSPAMGSTPAAGGAK